MNDIFLCKHCGKEIGIKQFGRHLWKIHKQKYEDYVKERLSEFSKLGWKLCSECGNVFRGRSEKCGNCFTKCHDIKENQYIRCSYCGENVHSRIMTVHLRTYHSVEFLQYVKEHLEDFRRFGWCHCSVCGTIMKSQSKIKNQPSCSLECLSKVRKTWVGAKSSRFGSVLSEETKKKISESNTGKEGLKGDLNPAHRPDVRSKISKTRIDRGVAKGEKNGMFGKTHTPEAIKKIFTHRKMNKLEKIVANEFDKNGIQYTFQFFITEGEVCKSYDFKIKGKPIIIEVDGDFWHGNPKIKNHYEKVDEVKINDLMKDIIASEKGYRVIRLWESDIKKDPSIVTKCILG